MKSLSIAVILVASPLALLGQAHHGAHWSYDGGTGPQHWAELAHDYELCGTGKSQSPIDVRGAVKADLPAIKFDYRPSPLKITNNGHTIQIDYAPGSFISVGGQKYQLLQFHFHHPSEEEVNGKPMAMDVHLVHKNEAGKLAVVGVLLGEGSANALIQKLWENLPEHPDMSKTPPDMQINATDLLPAETGYYTFTGSLTTPPCSEGVTWFVMKSPTSLSGTQVATFAKLYPHDARPVQPQNGRTIKESK